MIPKSIKNVKYKIPRWIPSYQIGDNVKDCCDGSDEGEDDQMACQKLNSEYKQLLTEEISKHKRGDKTKKEWIKLGKTGLEEMLQRKRRELITTYYEEGRKLEKLRYDSIQEADYSQEYSKLILLEHQIRQLEYLKPSHLGREREWNTLVGSCFSIILNEKEFKTGSFEPIAEDFEFELCPFLLATKKNW